jgi:tRNA A58 N-methylase Trm61
MVSKFRIGQLVEYQTNKGSSKLPLVITRHGRIVKLHQSCSHGVAEIKPLDGTKKISRRLQMVTGISEE